MVSEQFDKNNVSFERSSLDIYSITFSLVLFFRLDRIGELAQMVKRSLCMWEVLGSMPGFSMSFFFPSSPLHSKCAGSF